MKIVSKRGRPPAPVKISVTTPVVGRSIIITDHNGIATPEDIKAAEEIFKEIRRQLEEVGKILS